MERKQSMATKKTSIGGQALMEGIMMRGPRKTAMAVRTPKGEICLEQWENKGKPPKILTLPIIRGVYGMISSFVVGYKCLMRSAEISMEELTEEENAEKSAGAAMEQSTEQLPKGEEAEEVEKTKETESAKEAEGTEGEKFTATTEDSAKKAKAKPAKNSGDAAMTVAMTIGTVLGVLLAVGLFIYLPTLIYDLTLQKLFVKEGYLNRVIRSLFEGLIKIAILVAYMAAVSLMKDIRRTFMYHGAEHKTIFCYENGLPLTVENIRPMRRFHPRCGTSFLILMLLVSIVIGAFIPFDGILRAVCKLLLLPLTIGVGYELIKLAGRRDNLFTKIISAPGMWLQHITTKEPTDDMIECAIAAMNEVIPENQDEDNW